MQDDAATSPTERLRAAVMVVTFFGWAICLHVQQILGAPLYWLNRRWFYRWQVVVKESVFLLLLGLNQWRTQTKARISWDASIDGQIRRSADGGVVSMFPDRLVLISNHQIYTDWLFLWWTAYTSGHHGHLFIVLKESLRMVPIVGPGMMLFSWIFLSRKWESDKARLQHRLSHLSNKKNDAPMWLMIFPEGTNMSVTAHAVSKKWSAKVGIPELELSLVPRTRGLQFCLQELANTVEWIYDCTVAYDGIPPGEYGQEVFSLKKIYIDGVKPPLAHLYWRRFSIKDIPVGDAEAFDRWLNARWTEKEDLLKQHQQSGSFPASDGYILADIKLGSLAQLIQIALSAVAVLVAWQGLRAVASLLSSLVSSAT